MVRLIRCLCTKYWDCSHGYLLLLNQKLTFPSASAAHQQPQAAVKAASTAPRHPAAPPSPGLRDHLGGKGTHRQRILRASKRHRNMIHSYLVQHAVPASRTGQTNQVPSATCLMLEVSTACFLSDKILHSSGVPGTG